MKLDNFIQKIDNFSNSVLSSSIILAKIEKYYELREAYDLLVSERFNTKKIKKIKKTYYLFMEFLRKKYLEIIIGIIFFIFLKIVFKDFQPDNLILQIKEQYPRQYTFGVMFFLANILITIFFAALSLKNYLSNLYEFKFKQTLSIQPDRPNYYDLFQVYLGEVHHERTGEQMLHPVYQTIKGDNCFQNFFIVGGTGSYKTEAVIKPSLDNMLEYQYNNDLLKAGGLIVDVKGSFLFELTKICKKYRRVEDMIIVSPNTNLRWNPIDYADLHKDVLADMFKKVLESEAGETGSQEAYWVGMATKIVANTIHLIRLTKDYVQLSEVYSMILDIEALKSYVKSSKIHEKYVAEKEELKVIKQLLLNDYINMKEDNQGYMKQEVGRLLAVFTDPKFAKIFCAPTREENNFPGFREVIDKGLIVVLYMPKGEYGIVGKLIGFLLKMNYLNEILRRSIDLKTNKDACQRPVFLVIDEYQEYVNKEDSEWFGLSRESKLAVMVSTQMYSSILTQLPNKDQADKVIGNLRNLLILKVDGTTAEWASHQFGKEKTEQLSTTINENAIKTEYSAVSGAMLAENANVSQSTTKSKSMEALFESSVLTNLNWCQAIIKGESRKGSISPRMTYLTPNFTKPDMTYFERKKLWDKFCDLDEAGKKNSYKGLKIQRALFAKQPESKKEFSKKDIDKICRRHENHISIEDYNEYVENFRVKGQYYGNDTSIQLQELLDFNNKYTWKKNAIELINKINDLKVQMFVKKIYGLSQYIPEENIYSLFDYNNEKYYFKKFNNLNHLMTTLNVNKEYVSEDIYLLWLNSLTSDEMYNYIAYTKYKKLDDVELEIEEIETMILAMKKEEIIIPDPAADYLIAQQKMIEECAQAEKGEVVSPEELPDDNAMMADEYDQEDEGVTVTVYEQPELFQEMQEMVNPDLDKEIVASISDFIK